MLMIARSEVEPLDLGSQAEPRNQFIIPSSFYPLHPLHPSSESVAELPSF
jgi:hypothetical protein